jgi:hypothetical protein
VRLAWPSAGYEWDGWIDPLGLLARALGAWAAERVAVASSVDCVDPATGLVAARFLERHFMSCTPNARHWRSRRR